MNCAPGHPCFLSWKRTQRPRCPSSTIIFFLKVIFFLIRQNVLFEHNITVRENAYHVGLSKKTTITMTQGLTSYTFEQPATRPAGSKHSSHHRRLFVDERGDTVYPWFGAQPEPWAAFLSLGSRAEYFCKWPAGKYFRICWPSGLCQNYSTLPGTVNTVRDDMHQLSVAMFQSDSIYGC